MSNDVIKALESRRSIRSYKPDQITEEELLAVLEAGTYAPTAKGTQSPFIVAVQNPEDRATVARLNAAVMGVEIDPYYGAPTIVLVLAPDDGFADLNGSAVCTNMLNAAHSLGLASCWIHRSEAVFETEEGKALLEKWGLHDHLKGVASFSLGYAAGEAQPAKPRKSDYFRIV